MGRSTGRNHRRRRHGIVPRRSQPGLPPGTVTSDPSAPEPVVRVIAFSSDRCIDRSLDDPEELADLLAEWPVVWVDVAGLGNADRIARIGRVLGLHALSLEDVVNVHQRPKVEEYDEYEFVVLRMLEAADEGVLATDQFSLFLGKKFVATFQERPGDCLDPVRKRIQSGRGRVRSAGPDYLAYALLDAVVDSYFPLLEAFGDRLEELEALVIGGRSRETPERLLRARSDLLTFRRAVWPLREALSTLYRDETDLILEETRVYLRDCYDHVVQVLDVVEAYRELTNGLMDVFLSAASNRLNDTMRVLTVIATIFIPLTFVSSIYGMNFDPSVSPWNMPELRWTYGYPFAMGLMALIAIVLLVFFLRRGWLRADDLRTKSRRPRGSREREPTRGRAVVP